MAADGATWAVAVAFVLLGLLGLAYPAGASGVNWVVSGIVSLIVGWGMNKKK